MALHICTLRAVCPLFPSSRGLAPPKAVSPRAIPRSFPSRVTKQHVFAALAPSKAPMSPHPERAPRQENVAGEFYVDHTCIDCDTCRWMAPSVFSRAGDKSAVYHQPGSDEERMQALQALLSCPTASIHTLTPPRDIKSAQETFPLHISPDLPSVYHCGFHSAKSYGAASYYVQTPGCNVLVDSPRYTEILARRIEAMGGVDYMFLTHRDDVADHDRWARRLQCPRVIHEMEAGWRGTGDVEIQLAGEGPWYLPIRERKKEGSKTVSLSGKGEAGSGKLQILFTPGHTEGHCCLYLPPSAQSPGVMFSGDHLCLAKDGDGGLSINERYNWYSVDLQRESATKLRDYPFKWLLPGHGRRTSFGSEEERLLALEEL